MAKPNRPIDFFLPQKTASKGGPGSGNFGHGGLPGVHGGSSPTKNVKLTGSLPVITDEELSMLQKQLKENGGFSYNPITKKSPDSGFMVSNKQPTRVAPRKRENREEMREFMKENIEKLRNTKDGYFGGWVTSKSIHFDISRNFNTIKDASLRAIDQDQIGIFDLNTFTEIFAIEYLDHIGKSEWTKKRVVKTYNANQRADTPGDFIGKYGEELKKMFGEDFLTKFKERIIMADKKENKHDKERKHDWANKPSEEWTEEDWDDNSYYQNNRKPMRFQFGPDTTDEDIDKFLDEVLGPEPKE